MFELFESLSKTKTIGFTCGTFDLLHAGHIMMFEESKSYCDYLIVGLLSDPTISRPGTKNKPVESMWERFVKVQSVKVIDYVIPWDTEEDLINMLEMIRPDIRFVGEEYKDKDFTAKDLCIKLKIEIKYNRRTHKYSSTELRSRTGSLRIPLPNLPKGSNIIPKVVFTTKESRSFEYCKICPGDCVFECALHQDHPDPEQRKEKMYPTDIKVGDYVWDDYMKQPIKITDEESVEIHKSTDGQTSRTRFATRDEVDNYLASLKKRKTPQWSQCNGCAGQCTTISDCKMFPTEYE